MELLMPTHADAMGPATTAVSPEGFRGAFLLPDDPGYELARRHYNRRFDRRPAAVAQCLGVSDVRAALRWARERDLEVVVRSGGHGVHGRSVVEGGVIVDVAPMNDVHVDRVARTA